MNDIRLWKCNYQYNTRDKFVDFLKQNNITKDLITFKEQGGDDIEENTGVSFPG